MKKSSIALIRGIIMFFGGIFLWLFLSYFGFGPGLLGMLVALMGFVLMIMALGKKFKNNLSKYSSK